MTLVQSTWADEPVIIGKAIDSLYWEGAAELPLGPVGRVLVKNDATFLYLAFDVGADWGDDPGIIDWFWFVVDDSGDRAITPNRDRLYSNFGKFDRLTKSYFLAPHQFTTIRDVPPECQLERGFEESPAFPFPHRTWKMRLPLSEVGIDLSSQTTPPVLNVGFAVGSGTPALQDWFPDHVDADFTNLHQIVLRTRPSTTYPSGTEGAVIGGIGLIPATVLDGDGRATTDARYAVRVADSAFGGALNIIGNRATLQYLWAQGARRYRMLHETPIAGAFTPLRQAWVNYRWDGRVYQPESFGPADDNTYPMTDPSSDYSIDDLLLRWNTSHGYAAGIHHLAVEFVRPDGSVVAAPAQTLTLRLANAGPAVELRRISRNGSPVQACQQIEISGADPNLEFEIWAEDRDAGLASTGLRARWGENESHPLFQQAYAPPPPWDTTHVTFTPPDWLPPVTCAYAFEASASSRVTDGYNPSIRHSSVSRFVTVVRT